MKKQLERQIQRLEAKYGPGQKYVQMLKDQLSFYERGNRSAEDIFINGSVRWPLKGCKQ